MELVERTITELVWPLEDLKDGIDFVAFPTAELAIQAQHEWDALNPKIFEEQPGAHGQWRDWRNPRQSPCSLLYLQDDLRSLRDTYETEPNSNALSVALLACAEAEVTMPYWVARNLRKRISEARTLPLQSNSWDSVFGPTLPQSSNHRHHRDPELIGPIVASEVQTELLRGRDINTGLFQELGRDFGMSATDVETLFHRYQNSLKSSN